MRGCTVLLLFLLLCAGRPGLTGAKVPFKVAEGKDVTVTCPFYYSGDTKIFCKNGCDKEEDILVATSRNSGENGRYSLRYEEESFMMHVTIREVQLSDSGRYWCRLDRRLVADRFHVFQFEVTAPFSETRTYPLKPPVIPLSPTVRTTQSPGPGPDSGIQQGPGPGPDSGIQQGPGPGPDSGTSRPL